jgi:flavodoxin
MMSIMSRDVLTYSFFEEIYDSVYASFCSKRETFRQFFQKQSGAGIFLVKWRLPFQGTAIECGAGTN